MTDGQVVRLHDNDPNTMMDIVVRIARKIQAEAEIDLAKLQRKQTTMTTKEKVLDTHVFCFNPSQNGGEALILVTTFIDDGDEVPYIYQKLDLHSYGNLASFNIGSLFTVEKLRKLADELEVLENKYTKR